MSKMKEVAALLGVEINEEFTMFGYHSIYRITLDKMEYSSDGISWNETTGYALYFILTGRAKIIKLRDGVGSLENYAVGNCFKAKAEGKPLVKEV